jgi:mRNA-degrading endonuclease toxin of MazEF toxin-antitoxin module
MIRVEINYEKGEICMNGNELKRGDVFWAKLPKLENSRIQAGVRPVIVTSNAMALKHSPVIQYIPVTSEIKKTSLPVHVGLNNSFFPRPSMALVEQEGCIDKNRLMEKIGTLSEKDMLRIDRAILTQRGIDPRAMVRDMRYAIA